MFRRATALVRRRPEVVAYAIASAVTAVAGARNDHRVQKVSKTALMPLLAVGVAKAPELPAHERALLLTGLAAATAGDWILIAPDTDKNLVRGAGAFSVMQAAYSTLLALRGARPTRDVALQRAGALAVGSALLHLKAPAVARPLTGYGALLGTTATLAADPGLTPGSRVVAGVPVPTRDPASWLGLGGLLFTLSDGTIAVRRTLLKGRAAQVAEGFILASYATAQFLLVEGMSRRA